MNIFNRYGQPELRLISNDRLVTFSGKSVGFVRNKNIYDYNGVHRGWFKNGVVRDHYGKVVGFAEHARGATPVLPVRSVTPVPGVVEVEPVRPVASVPPVQPVDSMAWSDATLIELFRI